MIELTRRGFLGGVGGVLSLAVVGCGGNGNARRVQHADTTGELAANMYITVTPDGRISVAVNKAEIGQGVTTGFATLAADELSVPIEHVDVHLADSHPEYRTSYNMHQTGGSTSTKEAFDAIRNAAAAAREMLIGAAAASWGVSGRELTASGGKVVHAATKRELGYGELTKLASRRDVPEHPQLKKPSEFTAIGKTDQRVDLRSKVDGSAIFGIDVHVPDAVHAVVIHGPRFGARAESVGADAAKKRPGVIDVFAFPGGVAVVAVKYWQAIAAARDVEVTWSAGDTVGLDTDKLRVAMRAYKKAGAPTREDGQAERVLAEAKTKIEAVYEAPYLAHAPLEPQNCTVKIDGKRAEVWAPCQTPTLVQSFVADVIGGDRDDVLVHTTLAGGGFGRRVTADFAYQAAQIAKHVGKTVKMIWSRESDTTQGFYRPQFSTSMAGSVEGGKVTSLVAHGVSQSIALSSAPFFDAFLPGIPSTLKRVVVDSMLAMFATNSIPDVFATEGLRDTPYLIPNIRVDYTPVRTKMPVATWRSVGHSFNGFAMESFIDELAHAANADPLAFRKNMVKPGSSQMRVLDAIGVLSGWGTPLPPDRARGLARHHAFDTEVAEVAEVEIVDNRIKVKKVYCVVDCGIAVNPSIVRAQMEGAIIFGLSAALDQEITIVDGVVQQANFDTFPVLRMFEAPEIIVKILDSEEHPTGVGEPGLPPIAAATANAIFALTKIRLRRLPLQRAWNERGGAS